MPLLTIAAVALFALLSALGAIWRELHLIRTGKSGLMPPKAMDTTRRSRNRF